MDNGATFHNKNRIYKKGYKMKLTDEQRTARSEHMKAQRAKAEGKILCKRCVYWSELLAHVEASVVVAACERAAVKEIRRAAWCRLNGHISQTELVARLRAINEPQKGLFAEIPKPMGVIEGERGKD